MGQKSKTSKIDDILDEKLADEIVAANIKKNQIICESCKKPKSQTKTAMVKGKYYKNICLSCLGQAEDDISSNAAGYERRRTYEDNAQDTIQPYDANGKPRVEFYRLYPDAALKVFGADVVEELKRKI